jgi:virginiamycin A acetyltransferase
VYPARNTVLTHIKPTLTRKNIIAGEFSHYRGEDFESRVTHHYWFLGDKLIIGKFCQIGFEVEFIMNGANHQMNAPTTYPFHLFQGWTRKMPTRESLNLRGDTVVGNDVWIGQKATILPGVHIGDGAIIGTASVVGSHVAPYTIVAGNPAKVLRQRFDDELIDLLEKLAWWDRPIAEIQSLIPLLTNPDQDAVKDQIRQILAADQP